MKLIENIDNETKNLTGVTFWCPSCKAPHTANFPPHQLTLPGPTITGSIDHTSDHNASICRVYVNNGNLLFSDDTTSPFAGKTVPLPDYPGIDAVSAPVKPVSTVKLTVPPQPSVAASKRLAIAMAGSPKSKRPALFASSGMAGVSAPPRPFKVAKPQDARSNRNTEHGARRKLN